MTTVLVTGANRGIGLEFVRQYAREGASVIAACRSPEKARELAAIAAESREHVETLPLDVSDPKSVDLLARRLERRPIDILVNNAGVKGGDRQQFGGLDYDEWGRCLNVNLMGPLRLCEALAGNVAAGREKKIVNVSSRMGSITEAGEKSGAFVYRTSKAALNMATRLLARELSDRGVVILTVHPGWVRTDMGGPNATLPPEESVSGLRALIERADSAMSGRFWNYDGSEIPW